MQRRDTQDDAYAGILAHIQGLKNKVRRILDDFGPMPTSAIEARLGGLHQTTSARVYDLVREGRARFLDERRWNGRADEHLVEACDIPPPLNPRDPIGRGWVFAGQDGRAIVDGCGVVRVYANPGKEGTTVEVELRPVLTRAGRRRRPTKGRPDEPPAAPSAPTTGPSAQPSTPGASDAQDPAPDLPAWWGKE